MLPVWQIQLEQHIDSGKIVVIGVVQEQHPDRAKLYKQWRQLDWPILVDSLNELGVKAVPIPVAIDETGVVHSFGKRPKQFLGSFLAKEAKGESKIRPISRATPEIPDHMPDDDGKFSVPSLSAFGKSAVKYGMLDKAVAWLQEWSRHEPDSGRAHFQLGVALRRRSESSYAKRGDAQRAVDEWTKALKIDPNQYIWRRRLQQYGPRLDKPYDFYTWVAQAREEIRGRGEEPVDLSVEPSGSELLPPAKRGRERSAPKLINKDPEGKIKQDSSRLVLIRSIVTPGRVRPGGTVRVRVEFEPSPVAKPYWNNESNGLRIWLNLPEGVTLGEGALEVPNPTAAETREGRALEFELHLAGGDAGRVEVQAYALYYVCENKGGKCLYLRQDFAVVFEVDPAAPKLK